MTLFLLAAAGLAWGLLMMYQMVLPPRTNLVVGVSRWEQSRTRAATRRDHVAAAPTSPLERLGSVLAEAVVRNTRDLTTMRQDLTLTGQTLEGFLSRLLGLALVALFAPIALQAVGWAVLDLAIPPVIGVVAGIGLALAMVILSLRDLRTDASTRRAELRKSLSIYLDLTTMCLDGGRAPEEALPAAAGIGANWTFTWLQDAIETARWSRTTPGHELGLLGRRVGMPELIDLEATLGLSWESGAKLKASLSARADTLRDQRVEDAKAEARQATDGMSLALVPMAMTLAIYELFPPIFGLFTG